MECLFCKIATGEIPAKIRYSDETIIAFDDIHPQAPHHLLIIPRKHIATINNVESSDNQLVGQMLQVAKKLAHELQIAEQGYRVLMNCNAAGGQMVFHIHLHLLGGRQMTWPPG